MTLPEFIDMLRAIENGKNVEVGFGKLTLQEILDGTGLTLLREFLERVEQAEPPTYPQD